MKINLRYKLFFTLLGITSALIGIMYFLIVQSIATNSNDYIMGAESRRLDTLIPKIEQLYETQGNNWEFLSDAPDSFHSLIREHVSEGYHIETCTILDSIKINCQKEHFLLNPEKDPSIFRSTQEIDLILLDEKGRSLFGNDTPEIPPEFLKPIQSQQKTVGQIGIRLLGFMSQEKIKYLEGQNQAFFLIFCLIIVLSILLSWGVALFWEIPIRHLAQGTQALTEGKYDHRIPVKSNDELGQLSRDFNTLAGTLSRNEETRQQWMADISHELRTPLALLNSELEAIQDGIKKVTPHTFRLLHSDVQQLSHLVNDLYELSMSDIGALVCNKSEVSLLDILHESTALYRSEFDKKCLELHINTKKSSSGIVLADPERLKQLLTNLFQNSLSYTDPGGCLEITLFSTPSTVQLNFQDTVPRVPAHAHPHLFDRLYRVEESRNRALGGAGLGLSICKNIVEAHEGTIQASDSHLGGLMIQIELPLHSSSV